MQRREWDTAEYSRIALEREADEKKKADEKRAAIARTPAQARKQEVDLTSKLNKRVTVSTSAPLASHAGYYCEPCNCLLKDSMSYLDHINGKKHQRTLGMSMNFNRATVDDVKQRLNQLGALPAQSACSVDLKRERDTSNKEFEEAADNVSDDDNDLDDDIVKRIELLKKQRLNEIHPSNSSQLSSDDKSTVKLEERGKKQEDEDEYEDEGNEDMAKLMGFSSFTKSKKKS